jgi:lysophospholipase L1-like esterase
LTGTSVAVGTEVKEGRFGMPRRIVCAGDSNTRGQYGASYVQLLAERLRGHDVTVTGAGVNGDCSYNLLQRLDGISALRPDAVTVLIGSNDAWSTLSAANSDKIVTRKNLPFAPTLSGYRENLAAIVARLGSETGARVALISLPVLGQDINSPAARASADFSEVVKATAAEYRLAYLPLHERQREYLGSSGAKVLPFPYGLTERYTSVLQHFLLRRSYDLIARRRKLALTTDFIHQNSRGATIIADLIDAFVRESSLMPSGADA